jgi:hypothetical protein
MAATPTLIHTWSTSIKNDSGSAVVTDPPAVITGDAEVNIKIQIPPGATGEVDAAVPTVKIVSGFLSSDQAVDVYTNDSTGSTGQHIALAAKKAFAWNNTMLGSCPFTPTITKFFVTNPGSVAANFRAGFLLQE